MKRLTFLLLTIIIPFTLSAQGSVYLVLGSDTGIWEGLDVDKYYCTLGLGLYDDPARNAYTVMNPAFREQFKDSYGQPMKMTWWMMAGNMYRYATNKNVPVPNIMTLYLMKKYHGQNAALLGDELTLHYHTFAWTDYNNDGKYYWNQAKNFTECKEDFDVTLAQFLLEENIFPVSFRSGWHYMDNEWQNDIDNLIPYSLHNDYPAKRTSTTEPIDNVFDWSRSSKEFVPFHPSLSDYQIPGDGKSWNTRSYYMGSMKQADMDAIFLKAQNGVDQVPCLWAHLPEDDFPQNMRKIDSLAHISAAKYPSVKFSYCTAVEAMQRWRKGNDTTPPEIIFSEVPSDSGISFLVQTNENIFQAEPFVAVKDINEQYTILHCVNIGTNQWMTTGSYARSQIAKAGVAVTDTMGNLSTAFLNFIPDDIYIDNLDNAYSELRGAWSSSTTRAWGTNSRQCTLGEQDTAIIEWKPSIAQTRMYSLFMQIPPMQNPAETLHFNIYTDGVLKDSVVLTGPLTGNDWMYITTTQLTAKSNNTIQMRAYGKNQAGKTVAADVIRLTGLIKERQVYTKEKLIQPASVSEDDSTFYQLKIVNRGINDLDITDMYSVNNNIHIETALPFTIHGMASVSVPLLFYFTKAGEYHDTLIIKSNDQYNPLYSIVVRAIVEPYFRIVDNEDTLSYSESGAWAQSVAQAWGPTSRYAYSGTGASATFTAVLKKSGQYEILEIVPKTVNSVTNARYTIYTDTDTIGSVTIDQNIGSGAWVSLGTYALTNVLPVHVTVSDPGPAANVVLRADALKFQIQTPTYAKTEAGQSVTSFTLEQNYPNPFNPVTTIRFLLPQESDVTLTVYDMLGREVAVLVREVLQNGTYTAQFNGAQYSSGIYIYRIKAGAFTQSKAMVLLK